MKTLFFLFSFLLLTISCQEIGKSMSVNEMKTIDFNNSNNVLLDVRTPEEFANGNIPNSINLNVSSDDFDSKIEKLDTAKTYYIYCKSGTRSTKAVKKLHHAGFKHLVNLKDGYSNFQP